MKPSIIHILLALMLPITSCRSDKDRMAEIVEEWQGKEMVFPEVMTDFQTGDTMILSDSNFTILTYVDSAGCTSCKMRLALWNDFLYSLDSIANSLVKFLMVIDKGANERELRALLKRYDFNHSVYLDSARFFDKSYALSKQSVLNTFLLDEKKRVVVLGNPLYSETMNRMYKDLMSGKKTFQYIQKISSPLIQTIFLWASLSQRKGFRNQLFFLMRAMIRFISIGFRLRVIV